MVSSRTFEKWVNFYLYMLCTTIYPIVYHQKYLILYKSLVICPSHQHQGIVVFQFLKIKKQTISRNIFQREYISTLIPCYVPIEKQFLDDLTNAFLQISQKYVLFLINIRYCCTTDTIFQLLFAHQIATKTFSQCNFITLVLLCSNFSKWISQIIAKYFASTESWTFYIFKSARVLSLRFYVKLILGFLKF